MKWCCFVAPRMGGTYTVFRRLRDGLAERGIDVRWMAAGPEAHQAQTSLGFDDEAAAGCVVGPPSGEPRMLAAAMIEHLEEERYDGVFVNVLTDPLSTNLVRHLPLRLRRVMIVHNITPGTYAAARAIRDHVDATVGVSHRIREDLVSLHRFERGRCHTVINAPFLPATPVIRRPRADQLRVLFLGRIEDTSKGVFWLPSILRKTDRRVSLTVAGSGPDAERLRQICEPLRERVTFIGPVPLPSVPDLLARHDALIMPSRFEGFGIVLVEAMAMGCVPVASLLRGVTDTIVEDGHDGFLFPVGALAEAAGRLDHLLHDAAALARMSRNAQASAADRFDPALMIGEYARILERAMVDPAPKPAPLPLGRWQLPPGLRPGLRTRLPQPVKNLGRLIIERVR